MQQRDSAAEIVIVATASNMNTQIRDIQSRCDEVPPDYAASINDRISSDIYDLHGILLPATALFQEHQTTVTPAYSPPAYSSNNTRRISSL